MQEHADCIKRAEVLRGELACTLRELGRRPEEVTLLAATKMQSAERVRAVLDAVDACGENRVQELCEKLEAGAYTGKPVHFIGHLQTNKVKYVVGRCALIHSVDSLRLGQAISARALAVGCVQDVLAEVNIGREESKSGCLPEALDQLCKTLSALPGIRLRGLMTVPPRGESRPCFARMQELYARLAPALGMDVLSMGMSGDWREALAYGSTVIRVGTGIFGPRPQTAGQAERKEEK